MARIRQLLRAKLTDPADRGTNYTENFTGTGNTDFTLTNRSIKNTIFVTDDGLTQVEFVDYNIVYDDPTGTDTPIIRFVSAPGSGSAISIRYHTGASWIYPANPNINVISPMISISNITANETSYGMGEYRDSSNRGSLTTSWFQMDLYTKEGDTFTIDGGYFGGGKLLDYLAEEVLKTLSNNKNTLKKQGINDIKMRMGKDLAFSEATNLYRKLLDFEIEYEMDW